MAKLSKSKKKLIINISVIVALTAITILVLALSYRELNFENIGVFLKNSNGWLIAVACVCMLASILFEAVAIHIVSTTLGAKPKAASSVAYATSDVYYSAITPSASGGQPAAMFYMVRDGMPASTAGFTLVFNVIMYAAAILILGVFALCVHPEYFGLLGNHLARVLVIFGFVIQVLLISFAIMCMLWGKAIQKCGNGIVSLLTKMKIVKKPDKWREKIKTEVEKYGANRQIIKKHPFMCFWTLVFNLGQRISHTLITCCIVYAADPTTASFFDIFVMQVFVLLGYNSIPLPGGVGAYELMYISTYGICFGADNTAFILSAMMVSRVISYYVRMMVGGLYTLIYHAVGMKKNHKYADDDGNASADANASVGADGGNASVDDNASAEADGGVDIATQTETGTGGAADEDGSVDSVTPEDEILKETQEEKPNEVYE